MYIRQRGRPETILEYEPPERQRRREIRYRDPDIESFSSKNKLSLESGYFDHIRVTISASTLRFENAAQYEQFRVAWAEQNITNRNTRWNRPMILDHWLFLGEIHFNRNYESGMQRPNEWNDVEVEYALDLNPTRFINHLFQKVEEDKERFSVDYFRTLELRSLLSKEDENECYRGLDRNDNIVPLDIFKLVRPFEEFMSFYIESVLSFLNASIVEAMENCLGRPPMELDMTVSERFNWTINNSEVYWELCVQDELSFVNGLWNGFQAVLNETEKRSYYVQREIDAPSGMARSGRMQIENGVAIYANNFGAEDLRVIVYAKTHNRVRFEVRYNRSLQRLLNGDQYNACGNGLDGMLSVLALFKKNSRRRLKKLIQAMPDLALSERSDFHVLADFLDIVSKAHNDFPHTNMRTTLSLFINSGRVIADRGSRTDELMQRLARDHIVKNISAELRNDGERKIYHLTPRYFGLLRSMTSVFRVEQ